MPGALELRPRARRRRNTRRGKPAAMVFVRNRNGSHNPNEAMELADLMHGTDAMYRAMRAGWA